MSHRLPHPESHACRAGFAALTAALALPGASGQDTDSSLSEVVRANGEFAMAVHRELSAEKGNLCYSPLSISTALAMTFAGARGETAVQMGRVLRLREAVETHTAMGALLADLNGRRLRPRRRDPDAANRLPFELAVANSLWGQDGYPFGASFLELTQTSYRAALEVVDFKSDPEAARRRINGWVEEKTQDRIQDLLQAGDVTPDLRLALVNAIYFKSAWQTPFDEHATRDAPFHLGDGEVVDVPTMQQTSYFRHARADGLDIVKIPYEEGQASMVLLIPREESGWAAAEEALDFEWLGTLLEALENRFVALALPRFRCESRFVLNDVLGAMGMELPFRWPGADFTGISPTGELFLGFVIHQAFVDVHEKGTEAAAATAVGLRAGSVPPEPIQVRADRPFLFLIRDEKTGSILFLGRVADPRGE